MLSRRNFLRNTAAAAGSITVLPALSYADGHAGLKIGDVSLKPIRHASIIMETPAGVIYCDPVGEPVMYSGMPKPDVVLVTHEHGDHLSNDVLASVMTDDTMLITNAGAHAKMSGDVAAKAKVIGNGESMDVGTMTLDAIPAYNISEDRLKFHPKGRDNGYVMTMGDMRVYLSGDTEDIPEMRALEGIDLAFVCMNLPFTMDAKAAASAVNEFKPSVVVPYHYRGRDGGTQDPIAFAKMLDASIKAEQGDWYGAGKGLI